MAEVNDHQVLTLTSRLMIIATRMGHFDILSTFVQSPYVLPLRMQLSHLQI